MQIKELSFKEFDDFSRNHALGSFHQSSNYALLMTESDFEYDYVGYVDEEGNISAASLILLKKLTFNTNYGYAPKGFLMDYFNEKLLENFTKDLKEYYKNKKIVFIKINPEIAIGEINYASRYEINYNQNRTITKTLTNNGYVKMKRSTNFETKLPKFNAILSLKDFDIDKITKNTRNRIKSSMNKGLIFEKCSRDDIDILYNFIKRKKTHEKLYYKYIYNTFDKNKAVDIFLVKIDYHKYLSNMKDLYEKEVLINNRLNDKLLNNNDKKAINRKIHSDIAVSTYKSNMMEASQAISKNKEAYIAGALVIRFKNKASIFISGFDKKYDHFNPNYFLHYKIIEHYKDKYDYIDLNGISGSFDHSSKYHGLDRFKIGFHPKVYEFIGEFDLVIDDKKYKRFINSPRQFKKFSQKK